MGCEVKVLIDCVYCPDCLMNGNKNLLLYVDSDTEGIIFPYCKKDKRNIAIDLSNKDVNRRRGLIVPSGLSQVPAGFSYGGTGRYFI